MTLTSETNTHQEAVFNRFLPLARRTAIQYASRFPWVNSQNLESAALNDLWDAAGKVDTARSGAEISAFLQRRLGWAMSKVIREDNHYTQSQTGARRDYSSAVLELEARLMRTPTDEEIAAHLGLSEEEMGDFLSLLSPIIVRSIQSDEHEAAGGAAPSAQLVAGEDADAVRSAVSKLPERQRRVVELCYFGGNSLTEASAKIGVSLARVSLLHREALLRLRRSPGLTSLAA